MQMSDLRKNIKAKPLSPRRSHAITSHGYGVLNDCIVFDLETNGLHPSSAILEIGAVKVQDGIIVDKFKSFVSTTDPLDFFAAKVHNISKKDLKNAPSSDSALKEFWEFSEDRVLLAHNAIGFDARVLEYHLREHDFAWNPEYADSLQLSQKNLALEKHGLEDLLKHYDIFTENLPLHRAYTDAWLLSHVVSRLRVDAGYMIEEELELFIESWNNFIPEEEQSQSTLERNPFLQNIFSGAYVALTGEFENYGRDELISLVEDAGGIYQNNVTMKTNILLNAQKKTNLMTGETQVTTNKEKRAQELYEKGQDIAIMSEKELEGILAGDF